MCISNVSLPFNNKEQGHLKDLFGIICHLDLYVKHADVMNVTLLFTCALLYTQFMISTLSTHTEQVIM